VDKIYLVLQGVLLVLMIYIIPMVIGYVFCKFMIWRHDRRYYNGK
jgi:hypothetical protein